MTSKTSLQIVPGAPWVLIAVMGLTGTGKSTFIQTATQSPEVIVGHDLESCTSEMKGYTFHYKGHNVNLIDTPGFDDTHKSETEVLTSIATWLEESYGNHEKLNGVIYLHSINKPRMEGSALRNLRLFRQLCGESPLKNVVLGTTFWGAVNEEAGKSREKELRLRPEFWGQMVERGSRMMRVTDRASALEIVDYLMPMVPVPLEIQKEMVDQEKHLIDTAAGQHMNEELHRREELHREELQKIKEEHELAIEEKDEQVRAILEESQRRIENNLNKIYRQQEQLRAERRAEDRKRQNDYENHIQRIESISRVSLLERESTSDFRDMSFDELVARIRANEIKVNAQNRDKVEEMISETQQSPDLSNSASRKKKGTSRYLLRALKVLTPIVSMALLGVPIMLPSMGGDSDTPAT
ncbi:GTP-binding protein, HSR1-related [Penicillium camemberti]|uniref:GTP-binding protein, HSR1-related n=1 Tax=Penicillium camemberti (strain FM 013) TaxID=1429867 RepID=A0A0G4P5I2_PENC3|nr:GTP-binding protein, HSR1-related [Penicillium camemberti]